MDLLAGFELFTRAGTALPEATIECVICEPRCKLEGLDVLVDKVSTGPYGNRIVPYSVQLGWSHTLRYCLERSGFLADGVSKYSSPSKEVFGRLSPIVALRKELDLYANIRPVSPVHLFRSPDADRLFSAHNLYPMNGPRTVKSVGPILILSFTTTPAVWDATRYGCLPSCPIPLQGAIVLQRATAQHSCSGFAPPRLMVRSPPAGLLTRPPPNQTEPPLTDYSCMAFLLIYVSRFGSHILSEELPVSP